MNTHGGARQGAGRPGGPRKEKKYLRKASNFRLPYDIAEFLDEAKSQGENKTKLIVNAMRKTYDI